MKRKIVQIDEVKCNGCGLCVPACAEGAITIVDGKARLAADNLCDGLGACLGECPQDAIRIIERDADAFDEEAVEQRLEHIGRATHTSSSSNHSHTPSGCPGSRAMSIQRPSSVTANQASDHQPSMLGQWPVQLHLVPVNAPYLQGADLLIAADCVPFAYAGFHKDFLAGKAVVVGCPKLDDNRLYLDKLTQIFNTASIKSITVVKMEVPCCSGISMVAREALKTSGKDIPLQEITISIQGEVKKQEISG